MDADRQFDFDNRRQRAPSDSATLLWPSSSSSPPPPPHHPPHFHHPPPPDPGSGPDPPHWTTELSFLSEPHPLSHFNPHADLSLPSGLYHTPLSDYVLDIGAGFSDSLPYPDAGAEGSSVLSGPNFLAASQLRSQSMSGGALVPSIPSSGPSRKDNPAPPKQIRFVSHDGKPHSKRRRINAA